MSHDIKTPDGLLRELVVKNKYGVYFIRLPDQGKFVALPTYMQGSCKKALPDADVITDPPEAAL